MSLIEQQILSYLKENGATDGVDLWQKIRGKYFTPAGEEPKYYQHAGWEIWYTCENLLKAGKIRFVEPIEEIDHIIFPWCNKRLNLCTKTLIQGHKMEIAIDRH